MKKFLLILLSYTTFYSALAQITVSHATRKEEPINNKVIPYDSTKNWLGNKNVKSYIGQILYVKELSDFWKGRGYEGFKVTKEPHYSIPNGGRWGESAAESNYNTKYENLVGKYFIVLDVQAHSMQKENPLFEHYWYFKLQNRDNANETLWFEYSGQYEHSFPFIVVSYFNNLKNLFLGKKYILRYSKNNEKVITCVKDTDFFTGEPIIQEPKDRWECIDITIEGEKYKLVALVKNQNERTSYIPIEELLDNTGVSEVFEETEYANYIEVFGGENMDMVRRRSIKVGMTISLLLLSWGTPDKINRSSYGPDQYVYGNQYVYIENGVIKAWN